MGASSSTRLENSDWMSSLPDNVQLHKILIPGTHNSAAKGHWLVWVNCQSWSIPDQLRAGLRFFDIRGHFNSDSNLILHHGFSHLNKSLEEVIAEMIEFLKSHGGETIIMKLQNEYGPGGEEYKKVAEKLMDKERWWISNGNKFPSLRDVRGKIILFQNFGDESSIYGLPWSHVDVRNGFEFNLWRQAWKSSKKRLHEAKNEKERWYEVPLSATVLAFQPSHTASFVNRKALRYFQALEDTITCIISMDYANDKLVSRMVELAKKPYECIG